MSIRTDILVALTDEPLSSRELHGKIGQWARTAIRAQLAVLTKTGEIERSGVEFDYRYRRKSS